MKFILAFIAAIVGFFVGEVISRMFRSDHSTSGDSTTFTWVIKLVCAGILVAIVYNSCD